MRTRATYRIFGDSTALTADRVSQVLGIVPTQQREVGHRNRTGGQPASVSSWLLETPGTGDGVELAAQIQRLLTVLEPLAHQLWELISLGYDIDWFCYVGSYAMEHAVEIDRAIMTRLLAIPGDLLLDFYGDEPDEV